MSRSEAEGKGATRPQRQLCVICRVPRLRIRSTNDDSSRHPFEAIVTRLLGTLSRTLSWCAYRLTLFGTRKAKFRGLHIIADVNDPDHSQAWVAAVVDALNLLDRTAEFRFERMRRDVQRIIISGVVGPEYVHSLRAIRLHGPHLLLNRAGSAGDCLT